MEALGILEIHEKIKMKMLEAELGHDLPVAAALSFRDKNLTEKFYNHLCQFSLYSLLLQ